MTAADTGRELEIDIAVLAIAAGVIHAVVSVTHFVEFPLAGSFFAMLAGAQIAWGVMVWRRDRRLLRAGAIASAAVVLLWLFTRTVGLPLGPDVGDAEQIGPLDILATLDELATIGLVVALLRLPALRPRALRVAGRVGPVLGIALAIASLVSLTLGVHAH